jgi:hypothetical protein
MRFRLLNNLWVEMFMGLNRFVPVEVERSKSLELLLNQLLYFARRHRFEFNLRIDNP